MAGRVVLGRSEAAGYGVLGVWQEGAWRNRDRHCGANSFVPYVTGQVSVRVWWGRRGYDRTVGRAWQCMCVGCQTREHMGHTSHCMVRIYAVSLHALLLMAFPCMLSILGVTLHVLAVMVPPCVLFRPWYYSIVYWDMYSAGAGLSDPDS